MTVCPVCPHACQLADGVIGRCGQRIGQQGQVVAKNYGQISALAVDPVEKKPLYHFHPGKLLLSAGSLGCNLDCSFCQNHEIAHGPAQSQSITVLELLRTAEQVQVEQPDCVGIAFTYNEPVVGYEWVRDVVLQAPKQLAKVLVTNGFMNPTPWRELIQGLDALNIDVKAFREQFYQQQCGGSLAPVLRNVETAISEAYVELTYLVVPGLNDSADEVRRFSVWLAGVSPDVPVHFTRYFPNHRLKLAPTPLATLANLLLVAREELNFVYLGNVGQQPNTYCPRCEHLLIQRDGQSVSVVGMVADHCERCGRLIPGVGI